MRFAIGDIHGCNKSLQSLVNKKIRPMKGDRFFFVGDYIDRGPDSKAVIDFVMQLSQKYECHFLRGNHEQMMLEARKGPQEFGQWIMNNGDTTLNNFGIADYQDLQEKSLDKVPEKYLEFIENTQYYLDSETDCFFVHAGLNFSIQDPLKDKKAMVWKRNISYDEEFLKGKYLIHGHTPQPLEEVQLQIAGNRKLINLDGGCVYKHRPGLGKLVALNLDQWRLLVQDNID